jgi:uncharacterized protein YdaU (DUF1376 family)
MKFVKHWIGDYARDTGDLTITEHGAYRLMLDHFYGMAKPLPSEKKVLHRLLRAETDADRKAIDKISFRYWRPLPEDINQLVALLDLHSVEDQAPLMAVAADWTEATGLINLRALREIVRAQVVAEKNRKIAIEREERRRQAKRAGGQS